MRKITLLCWLVCAIPFLRAQPLLNYAYGGADKPLAFLKYDTYTFLLSSDLDSGLRLTGINNDGSIRFNKIIEVGMGLSSNNVTGIYGNCSPTPDKGMLMINTGTICQGINFYEVVTCTRIDSIGSTVFMSTPYAYSGGCSYVSNTFYFLAGNQYLSRLDPVTGMTVNTIHTATSDIICSAVNAKKQIIIGTNNSLSVIDTSGSVSLSAAVTTTYSRIKPYKKNYYLMNSARTIIDQKDSLLSPVASLNSEPNCTISDYSIFNDSLVVALYNSSLKKSIIRVYATSSLSPLSTGTINIANHKIEGVVKDKYYNFLISEKRGEAYGNSSTPGSYFSLPFGNSGLASFASVNDISYPGDVVLKSLKTHSFSASGPYGSRYNVIDFRYQHSLIVYNNSAETIKNLRIAHPRYLFIHPSAFCSSFHMVLIYNGEYNVSIKPFETAEIQLPAFSGSKSFSAPASSYEIEFCYYLSAPGNRVENDIENSSLCSKMKYIVSGYEGVQLSPNPTSEYLVIDSQQAVRSYSINDLSGRFVKFGNDPLKIDVRDLSAGVYLITFKTDDNVVTKKFVKE